MTHFIRNLSISHKLMLLLLLPALAALWLALGRLNTSWQQVSEAQHVSQAIEAAATMNALVATLQAERGASGVYLASNGNRFTQRLQQLRQQSDQRLQPFLALQLPELSALQQQLRQLNELRRQIDQLSITNSLSAERYTGFITAMIAQNHQLEAQLSHREMARQLARLNQFIEMKERAGRERAILGLVFSRTRAVTPYNSSAHLPTNRRPVLMLL